ncbi:GtrA family protein [Saccharospirillum sp. HFRX-1]|uniref:GtrA family protein n=1 Tax=unclassified Saccharospirillum TaxID=2633430 RepID=UPI00371AE2E6
MLNRLRHSTHHAVTLTRYALVASLISVIDAGGLYALHEGLGWNVFISRVCSYLTAMTTGYFLNRQFTFHNHQRVHRLSVELAHYYGVHSTGGLINYGVFSLTLLVGHQLALAPVWDFWLPLLGVWLGGIAGMSFNYSLSNKLIFRRHSE